MTADFLFTSVSNRAQIIAASVLVGKLAKEWKYSESAESLKFVPKEF